MKSQSEGQSRGGKYDYNGFFSLCLVIVTLSISAMDAFLIRLSLAKGDIYKDLVFIFLLLCPLMLARTSLSWLSISLNEDGISASIFGITTKKIEWDNVKKIRKIRVYVFPGQLELFEAIEQKHNFICGFLVNICGNIAFSQNINQCRNLLDYVNVYAHRHEIPLVVMDPRAAATRISQDPAPGRWRRGMAIDAEEKVAEL